MAGVEDRDSSTTIAIVPPAAAAQILGGNLVYTETRNGQWISVIEMERIVDAKKLRAV